MTSVVRTTGDRLHRTRIVLAIDLPLMHQAIRAWLERQQDLEIVAEVTGEAEALQVVAKLHPDVVVMDIGLLQFNGLDVIKQIRARCPNTKILIAAAPTDPEYTKRLLQAGADGYYARNASGQEVMHAIRTIVSEQNGFLLANPPDVVLEPLDDTKTVPQYEFYALTERELVILKLAARGMNNKDIAHELGVNLRCVKGDFSTLFLKIGVSSRTQAISFGLKSGILTLADL